MRVVPSLSLGALNQPDLGRSFPSPVTWFLSLQGLNEVLWHAYVCTGVSCAGCMLQDLLVVFLVGASVILSLEILHLLFIGSRQRQIR